MIFKLYLENNLYGWSLKEPLTYAEFGWMTKEQIDSELSTKKAILELPDHGDRGYILEVDLGYPKELHDMHADYPLAPEKKQV